MRVAFCFITCLRTVYKERRRCMIRGSFVYCVWFVCIVRGALYNVWQLFVYCASALYDAWHVCIMCGALYIVCGMCV